MSGGRAIRRGTLGVDLPLSPDMVIQPTTVTQSPRAWYSRLWIPIVITFVGVRQWIQASETPLGTEDLVLRGLYFVIVPISW